jgi:hypothetical protein
VEKLGHLVEKQTEFLGNLLPKLLGQQEAKEDSKRERDFTPSTKDPSKAQGVLPNLKKVDTAAVKDTSVDYSVSRNPKQHAFSDVSGAKAVMMGLNAKTEAQVTSKKSTITPIIFYANESDRRGLLIDLIMSSKGNTIIYVNDEQRRNHLAEFLLDRNLGEFSERILLTTTQNMISITGMDNEHDWQKFLDDVTAVVNYDAPPDLEGYKGRITRGMNFTNKDVLYTSIIDHSTFHSSPELYVDLLKLLTDSRTLETLRMIPRPDVPSWFKDMVRTYISHMSPQPTFQLGHSMGSSKQTRPTSGSREFRGIFNAKGVSGASRPARPASGSREFRNDFNAHVAAGVSPQGISTPSAGVSPEKITMPSEVRREHVGMRPGDWYCYDCQGFVWESKTVCDSFKCQRRRQEKGISASKMVNSFRTVSIAVDDEEDTPCPTNISPVANERAELKDTSFVLNVFEDTSYPTDDSSVPAYAQSGEQAELKRARGVRDPAYQREILANRKIVWHADKGIWVELDAPGGSDQDVEATTDV